MVGFSCMSLFVNESKDPVVIASLVQQIIQNRDLHKRMSISCHNYAKDRFMASKVAKRLENIYKRTLSGSVCNYDDCNR